MLLVVSLRSATRKAGRLWHPHSWKRWKRGWSSTTATQSTRRLVIYWRMRWDQHPSLEKQSCRSNSDFVAKKNKQATKPITKINETKQNKNKQNQNKTNRTKPKHSKTTMNETCKIEGVGVVKLAEVAPIAVAANIKKTTTRRCAPQKKRGGGRSRRMTGGACAVHTHFGGCQQTTQVRKRKRKLPKPTLEGQSLFFFWLQNSFVRSTPGWYELLWWWSCVITNNVCPGVPSEFRLKGFTYWPTNVYPRNKPEFAAPKWNTPITFHLRQHWHHCHELATQFIHARTQLRNRQLVGRCVAGCADPPSDCDEANGGRIRTVNLLQ